MGQRIIDLSTPIDAGHFRWKVERRTPRSHAAGDIFEATWLGFVVHAFTHMDTGVHFAKDGYTTDDVTLDRVMGEAAVVDVSSVAADSPVTEQVVSEAGGHIREGDIVLLWAGWDLVESIDAPEFWTRAPYMTVEACRWLRGRGIKAIAYDFPQDRCIRDLVTGERSPAWEENTTHVELLLKGVLMFEYLCNMTAISRERVQFIGLPLKVPGCDGAPVRAVAIEEG